MGNDTVAYSLSLISNNRGQGDASTGDEFPIGQMVESMPVASRCIVIRLRETDHIEYDCQLLDGVKKELLEFRGVDEVRLEVSVGDWVVLLDWPILKVKICDELQQRLRRALGSDGDFSVLS